MIRKKPTKGFLRWALAERSVQQEGVEKVEFT